MPAEQYNKPPSKGGNNGAAAAAVTTIDAPSADTVAPEPSSVDVAPQPLQPDTIAHELPSVSKEASEPLQATATVAASAPPTTFNHSALPTQTRKIIDFSNKIYVAPLTTVGKNLPFRRIMKRFGADITCGEMALASNLLEGKPSEWALLKRHPDEDIFGIQLAAGYPDIFTRTMELVETHLVVDFVDLNLGCPLDLVCNKGSGAALMMRDKRLQASLRGITTALTKCPVTIKMRTGWDEKAPFCARAGAQNPALGLRRVHWRRHDPRPLAAAAVLEGGQLGVH